MSNEERAEKVRKQYDDAHSKVLPLLAQLRTLATKMQIPDIHEHLDMLEDAIDDMHLAANEVGSELTDAATLADAYDANEEVNAAVRRADNAGAWMNVRTILEAASYAAAERHGAHNVEAKTLEAFMQYRA